MVPATTLEELYNNLNRSEGFALEDAMMYVNEIFDRQVKLIRRQLLVGDRKDETIFVCGQRGTGKTTALTFLPDERIREKFAVVYVRPGISVESGEGENRALSIVNVMVNIAETLIRSAKDKKVDAFFQESALPFINFVKKVNGKLVEEEIRLDRDFHAHAEEVMNGVLKAVFSLDRERSKRRQIRETFDAKIEELHVELQKLIASFEKLVAGGKPLLLVIDDWEKLIEQDSIQNIFGAGIQDLKRLQCRKVVSIPVMAAANESGRQNITNTSFFTLKIESNPFHSESSGGGSAEEAVEINRNRQLFKKIIMSRIDPAVQDTLVDDASIAAATDASGGIVRQFLEIMATAAIEALVSNSKYLRKDFVDTAARHRSSIPQLGVDMKQGLKELLIKVQQTHDRPDGIDAGLFEFAIANGYLIFNLNGRFSYRPNPLIRHLLSKS